MAWQDEAIPMLRVLINDLSDSPTYSDNRLEQALVVAAKLVYQEISFDYTYTITIEDVAISPDPTSNSDNAFINFFVLRAACIMDQSTFRTKAAAEGIRAALGPASLAVAGNLAGFKTLLDVGPCAAYAELKDEYQFGNVNVVKAVLSPFVGNRFDPRSLRYYNTDDRCR